YGRDGQCGAALSTLALRAVTVKILSIDYWCIQQVLESCHPERRPQPGGALWAMDLSFDMPKRCFAAAQHDRHTCETNLADAPLIVWRKENNLNLSHQRLAS